MMKHKLVIGIGAPFDKNYIISSSERAFVSGKRCVVAISSHDFDERVSFLMNRYREKINIVGIQDLPLVDFSINKFNFISVNSESKKEISLLSDICSKVLISETNMFIAFDNIQLKGQSIVTEEISSIAFENKNVIAIRIDNTSQKPMSAQKLWDFYTTVDPAEEEY